MPDTGYRGRRRLRWHDLEPGRDRLLVDVLAGLQKRQKELPCKYLYDAQGSRLYERICQLSEYYLPAVEAAIMSSHIDEMARLIGQQVRLIEYGCGNCEKVRFLLDHLDGPVAYIPIDISRKQLRRVARELSDGYPELEILPVCADYTSRFDLPIARRQGRRAVAYFPGSTIGNFAPAAARQFLKSLAKVCGPGGGLLIGVDLEKDPAVLHRAYNDSQGVTAAFNLNLLERINRELGADFQTQQFEHYAFYNRPAGRVEMHLISRRDQTVRLDEATITFARGETVWTESSYKYSLEGFQELAAAAGWLVERVWTDDRQWCSVQYLVNARSA
ncbi:MAG: L-histidine N(alpha)-methyltransferase [Dehalococcoidia bacterium]